MRRPIVAFRCAYAAVGASVLMGCMVLAQQPNGGRTTATSESTGTNPPSLQPPTPKSPVDLFRNLLAMPAIERREFIAKKPAEVQKLISDKVREYEGLTAEQRELRLRVTELRWYLRPMLGASVADRNAGLVAVPEELRDLVTTRLQEWDKLTPESQKELLDNESTVRFYFELAAHPPAEGAPSATNPASQAQLDAGIRHWQALTDGQRAGIVRHFKQFFDLTPAEKDRTLGTLSEPERIQIEKTLRTFGDLTPAQRSECLKSFQKFVSLSPAERQQFLKSAARWQRMTPTERQSWRSLVSAISHQPPLPPGMQTPRLPPSPMQMKSAQGPKPLVTQTN